MSLLFVVVAGALGSGVFGRLSAGGFTDPAAESSRAKHVLETEFRSGEPNLVFIVDARQGEPLGSDGSGTPAVDSDAVTREAERVTDQLKRRADVAQVVTYWSMGRVAQLRSIDGTAALIVARVAGDEDQVAEAIAAIRSDLEGTRGAVTLSAAGQGPVFADVSSTIEGDLTKAESIAVPITILLLIVVFGGLVASSLPLVVGVVSVLGTFLTLFVITLFTDVSIFSINLVTALGLGLAIDYSLFIVSRYREELALGFDVEAAVVRTVETAGRTVAVSAVTVAVSLAALLVFPLFFLRSFAYAGIGVTLVSLAASVITLPAVLAMLGHRVNALSIRRRPVDPDVAVDHTNGMWHRIATAVMRRPLPIATAVIVVLVLLGLPFLGVDFGTPDQRVLPTDAPARQATDRLRTDFSSHEAQAFPIVATQAGGVAASKVVAYATRLSRLDGVQRVDSSQGRFVDGKLLIGPDATLAEFASDRMVRFSVVPEVVPVSSAGERLIHTIRATSTEGLGPVLVGGSSAQLVDSKAAIAAKLPIAGALIAGATFVLLFLMFGSVIVPLKAIVLNLLSLTATFGAMVWVFQEGHLSGWLGFTPTGMTDLTTPILMFCIAFGLSMDYEVFLLSRIKEEFDRTGDNTASVALGLEKTGRIVTAAAALLAVTFVAFSTSGISFIKLFGLGLTLAVLMDATLVRGALVPAFMKLAGAANWWSPRWLRPVYERFGFSESADHAADPVVVADLDVTPASGGTDRDPRAAGTPAARGR